MKRLQALDLLRGLGITAMVFLHSAVFHYREILTVDFDNPPLVITVVGFLLMWAGLFAIISAAAYTFSSGTRLQRGTISGRQLLRNLWLAGLFLLALHYLYFLVLGSKLLDFTAGDHRFAVLPGLLATGTVQPLHPDRIFYATTLSMIGWNLLLIAPLLYLLYRRLRNLARVGVWLAALGTAVMILSLLRIPLYPLAQGAIERGAVLPSVVLGFLVNKNNPILPYLAFGLFGAWLGLTLIRGVTPRSLRPIGLVGLFWVVAGFVGMMLLPSTMLEREIDLYWYFLTTMQLGFFLLIVVAALLVFDLGRRRQLAERLLLRPLRVIGTVSLTVFLLETTVAEVLARFASVVYPAWNLTIGRCLAFGAVNAILWVAAMNLWARYDFKYSVEWLTVRLYGWLKRPSGKLPPEATEGPGWRGPLPERKPG